jgi:hypothetical protein
MAETDADQAQATREAAARKLLLAAGASSLPRPPWLHKRQPPAAGDLIQFALWHGRAGEVDESVLLAALALLPAARAEVDQLEAGLLFAARAHGLSWPQISRALGLASAQAAAQRYDRVAGRVENRRGA